MKYLHLFDTVAEYNEARSSSYEEPWVSLTEANDEVNYNKTEDEKLFGTPFTIKALGSGNISWSLGAKTLQYSKNGGTWTTMDSATTIPVVAGDEVQFKGTNANYSGNTISSTAQFNAKGNIMSLTDGDNFETADTVGTNAFDQLFRGCVSILSSGKLKLPSTTLSYGCYNCMFLGCANLTDTPVLPANTLAEMCYRGMFSGCTSLTTAPELPATTLANQCYLYMFYGCTSITTAPVLSATTLATGCYSGMFQGCTSLTKAPKLPATTLADSCYYYMFSGCTSLTIMPEILATTLAANSCRSMFQRCTNLSSAAALPATTLADSCYRNMFNNCTNLTSVPSTLPATVLISNCYAGMFANCASIVISPELPATTLVDNCYAGMFNGCSSLNHIKAMFTTTPSATYTNSWVNGVASTGTFVKNSAAQWDVTGADGIPTGWTVETATS